MAFDSKTNEFQDKMNGAVAKEADLNERKRRYNKECGRKAVVDSIMYEHNLNKMKDSDMIRELGKEFS